MAQSNMGQDSAKERPIDAGREAIDTLDQERVADARASARWLRWIAASAVTLGVLSFLLILHAYLWRELGAEKAVAAAFGTTFFTILSGATSYGAASNLDINASRMERQILRGGHS
jgi:hypothetical protein